MSSLWWIVSPGGQRHVHYQIKRHTRVADAFFNQVVCRFGMPSVIHSDQGQEFENKIMQELCLLCGSHKTRTTPTTRIVMGWLNVLIGHYL